MLHDIDSVDREPAPTPSGPWSKAFRAVFTCVALVAMAVAIWRSRDFLAGTWSGIGPGKIAVAVGLWATTHLVSPSIMVLVLGRARPIGYGSAFAVHALRLPAKYLPGGIWHMVGRVNDLLGMGHARRSLVEFILMENLIAAGFALGFGASLVLIAGEAPWRTLLTSVAVLAFVGLALIPWTVRFVGGVERPFPLARYARLLAVTAAFWALASTAFVVFLSAFGPEVVQASVAEKAGIYLLSWGAGFVAFFAPQGIGVFEFVAGTLLNDRIALAEGVALMAIFRIVVLAGDIVAWIIAVVTFRRLA